MSKTWTLDVQENEKGELFIELNDEILEGSGFKIGDDLLWTDNKDGSLGSFCRNYGSRGAIAIRCTMKIATFLTFFVLTGCSTTNFDASVVNITINSPVGSFPVPIRDLQSPYRK